MIRIRCVRPAARPLRTRRHRWRARRGETALAVMTSITMSAEARLVTTLPGGCMGDHTADAGFVGSPATIGLAWTWQSRRHSRRHPAVLSTAEDDDLRKKAGDRNGRRWLHARISLSHLPAPQGVHGFPRCPACTTTRVRCERLSGFLRMRPPTTRSWHGSALCVNLRPLIGGSGRDAARRTGTRLGAEAMRS